MGVDLIKHPQAKIYFLSFISILISAFLASPAIALIVGILLALSFNNLPTKDCTKYSKFLLQTAVVLLGFNLEIGVVLRVGYSSIGITIISIATTFLVGVVLGKILKVENKLSTLISSGTAICGGSAIAAMAPAIGAQQIHIASAMAVVFILNGVGLVLFPYLGHFLGLTQPEFGIWAALAIHDTSSVTGACASYGVVALAIGTTIKLTRALWILPLSFIGAKLSHTESKAKFPLFLLGFLLAAVIRTYVPQGVDFGIYENLVHLGKMMMTASLFFVGLSLNRDDLKKVGISPFVQAVLLWVIVSISSLALVKFGWFKVG